MSDFTSINSISLGTTFGAWYAKTNEMITRLNALKVGGITGGDGILVRPQTSTQGGYTLDIGDTVSKNVIFNGNVTINGVLSSSYGVDVSGINVVLPANTGVTIGNIVYVDSTGKIEKALANDECTSEVVGVVVGFTGGNAQVATTGKISGSSVVANFLGTVGATLQKGVVYFLSGGVSGAGTTLEPDVTSYVSKPMLLGLTGDTGLILPYRGYIGLTAASSSSSANVTATSGVLSINGITAALWDSAPFTVGNLKQTGHLNALSYFQVTGSSKKLSKTLNIDIDSGFSKILPVKSGGISKIITDTTGFTDISSGVISRLTNQWVTNPDDGLIFSTSGITADVYKITKIKVIPRSSGKFTFSLQKEYNAYAGTTGISSASSTSGPIVGEHYLRIELRRNGYAIAGDFIAGSNPTLQYSSETATSTIIEEDIHPIRYTPEANETFTVGITAGSINGLEDVNGAFPITHPYTARRRCNTYNINNVTLGGSGSDASKYMKAANQSRYFDATSGVEGYTLESAILGWNAQYGAVSENLYFVPVSVINNLSGGTLNFNIDCNILLELYKYDVNTKSTTGNVIIVSGKYSMYAHSTTFGGSPVNNTYTSP
jgi:hypothetical protein